jgi:hypothetical protein
VDIISAGTTPKTHITAPLAGVQTIFNSVIHLEDLTNALDADKRKEAPPQVNRFAGSIALLSISTKFPSGFSVFQTGKPLLCAESVAFSDPLEGRLSIDESHRDKRNLVR